jgi:hypothetical protein
MAFENPIPGSSDDVWSTEDLFDANLQGFPAQIMVGPFDTRDDAHYALDVAWKSPQ